MARARLVAGLVAALLVGLAALWLTGGSGGPSGGSPRAGQDPVSGLTWVDPADLPTQARTTLARIAAGGPFPYDRDGVTFANRERLLPRERYGYYREYTVTTPGEDDRGARRVVAGTAGERYYSADHYDSFSRVRGDAS